MERTLHRDFDFSDEIFQREKERIFFREWVCAGREEELPGAGDYLVLDVLGESVIVVRTRQGALAAHYNVCRHRGSRLANWKVLLENYNECYHCGPVHPELCRLVPAFKRRGGSDLDWERGIPHREGAWTFTETGTINRRPFEGLNDDERVRHKGELITISIPRTRLSSGTG